MSKENQDTVLVSILHTLNNMNDRISMHAHEFRDGFTVLNAKIDQISKVQKEDKEELVAKIHEVEKVNLKDNHQTNLKVAGLSATVALIVSIVGYLIKIKL